MPNNNVVETFSDYVLTTCIDDSATLPPTTWTEVPSAARRTNNGLNRSCPLQRAILQFKSINICIHRHSSQNTSNNICEAEKYEKRCCEGSFPR